MRWWIVCGLLLLGCGENPAAAPGAPQPAVRTKSPKPLYDAAEHAGVLRGRVTLEGQRPEPRFHVIGNEDHCAEHWAATGALNEKYVVSDDGAVPNAVVFAHRGPHKAFRYEWPSDQRFRLVQKDCYYVPHVSWVPVGADLEVSNADGFKHNVHIKSGQHDGFNRQQDHGKVDRVTFRRNDYAVKFACDLHSFMTAFVFAVDHPFIAVTGDDGAFEITGLPAGEYTFRYWHEAFAEHHTKNTFQVTVGDAAPVTHEIRLRR